MVAGGRAWVALAIGCFDRHDALTAQVSAAYSRLLYCQKRKPAENIVLIIKREYHHACRVGLWFTSYIPYSSLRISASGRCASDIWRWVCAMSYSIRWNWTVPASVSRMAQAER